jgi:hypothetical protein
LLRDLKKRPRPTQGCKADDEYDDDDVEQFMGFVRNNKNRKENSGMEWTRRNRKPKKTLRRDT